MDNTLWDNPLCFVRGCETRISLPKYVDLVETFGVLNLCFSAISKNK